ncbi:MAG: RNA polymerase-binding protein DksA [Gammaproteobacteria bacterium]|nr:RNA polymerase-binding protein DksA [Gammaproteobacteria bacterium]
MRTHPETSITSLDSSPRDSCTVDESALLAMPESDYMGREQLDHFRARLLLMRAELLLHADETRAHLRDNEPLADPNDRATIEEENLLEQRVRDRERKHLRKIEAALNRIDAGTYGYCLETGEPIGVKRLLARPTAEYCLEIQEAHERLERLHGL